MSDNKNNMLIPVSVSLTGKQLTLQEIKEAMTALVFGNEEKKIPKNAMIARLQEQSTALEGKAKDLVVKDDAGVSEANKIIDELSTVQAEFKKGFEETKRYYDQIHKHICGLEREALEMATKTKSVAETKKSKYLTEKQAKIREENLRAQAEAAKQERLLREQAEKAAQANKPEKAQLLLTKADEVVAPQQAIKETWWKKDLIIRKGKEKEFFLKILELPGIIEHIELKHLGRKMIIDANWQACTGVRGKDGHFNQIILDSTAVINSYQTR